MQFIAVYLSVPPASPIIVNPLTFRAVDKAVAYILSQPDGKSSTPLAGGSSAQILSLQLIEGRGLGLAHREREGEWEMAVQGLFAGIVVSTRYCTLHEIAAASCVFPAHSIYVVVETSIVGSSCTN